MTSSIVANTLQTRVDAGCDKHAVVFYVPYRKKKTEKIESGPKSRVWDKVSEQSAIILGVICMPLQYSIE